eukprot:CAMPEP_0174255948 /NCGR_PEP_ID=MMETSP0439-20130205/5228_1 /TAXON_ID=0 /ORGANISM="Stereomyxa ramosa, Strain Chinc5" /LENGTH=311 /DNA_ID=CAMNT_0015338343 /DNA_START=243 /DNA_END=1175 /DNA_ORIENTATION=+
MEVQAKDDSSTKDFAEKRKLVSQMLNQGKSEQHKVSEYLEKMYKDEETGEEISRRAEFCTSKSQPVLLQKKWSLAEQLKLVEEEENEANELELEIKRIEKESAELEATLHEESVDELEDELPLKEDNPASDFDLDSDSDDDADDDSDLDSLDLDNSDLDTSESEIEPAEAEVVTVLFNRQERQSLRLAKQKETLRKRRMEKSPRVSQSPEEPSATSSDLDEDDFVLLGEEKSEEQATPPEAANTAEQEKEKQEDEQKQDVQEKEKEEKEEKEEKVEEKSEEKTEKRDFVEKKPRVQKPTTNGGSSTSLLVW